MKSISIYAITRKQNLAQLSRMERQLSKREKPLKMREWELDSLKNLVEQLEKRNGKWQYVLVQHIADGEIESL